MLTASKKRKLRRMAHLGELEVEHLLELVSLGDSSTCSFLDELSTTYVWNASGFDSEGSRVVPLARWAQFVAGYLDGGYTRLIEMATEQPIDSSQIAFASAVLEELKTPDSVKALLSILSIVEKTSAAFSDEERKVVSALNIVLSFKGRPTISDEMTTQTREYLHECLSRCSFDLDLSLVVCALRGVGDEKSIAAIDGLPELEYPYNGTQSAAKRAIRKRLKAQNW